MNTRRYRIAAGVCLSAAALMFAAAPRAFGQAAAAPATGATAQTTQEAEDMVKMNPFVVDANQDAGNYRATSTLAGTRVRTDLRDVASSISVVTSQFLQDIGATNNQTLLQYTTNTEVGGVYGNYAGVGSTYINGVSESSNFIKPSTNTRVRGLDSADNTRDYFLTDLPWDSYITGRVDLQRGPNSILFGIGSPAGVVNSSLNTAETSKSSYRVENRIGSFGTLRFSADINQVIIKDELAVRIAALDDDTKYHQTPAYNHDRRLFGALTWNSNLFKALDSTALTTVRANYEYGDVKANRPRVLPPEDRVTPFFDPAAINKTVYDPFFVWQAGLIGYPSSNAVGSGTNLGKNYWLVQYPGPGIQATNNPVFYYDTGASGSSTTAREGGPNTYFAINSAGGRDGGIDGIPYGSQVGIAGFSEMTNSANRNNALLYPGASAGFYKSRSMIDPSIFDFYNILLDGPNKKEWQGWKAYNITLDQTFLRGRLGLQVVYDRQQYHDGQERNLNNPYISVDIDLNTMANAWPTASQNLAWNGQRYVSTSYAVVPSGSGFLPNPTYTITDSTTNPGTNANVGRAFVGSGLNNGGNSSNASDRQNFRAMVTGEVRADDFLRKSWLTNLLGRHVITGLYSHEEYNQDIRHWVRYGATGTWSDAAGLGAGGSGTGGLVGGDRVLDWITYLSDPLFSRSTASGLHLPGITAVQAPAGSATITYFDSHWRPSINPTDPTYVDPNAQWFNPKTIDPAGNPVSTQSENPANYVGWRSGTFDILNADQGDINSLYVDATKIRKVTESTGVTWQAFLWDDTLVATVGLRRDEQRQSSGEATVSPVTGAADMNYGIDASRTDVSKATSLSWGLVLHTPKAIRERLPWGTDIALTYSYGKNIRAENRYGFDGQILPNASGITRDWGIVISTLHDRVQLKATIYNTKVKDANLSTVTTEVSTLGSNTYYLYLLEAWGTASALSDLAGIHGDPNYAGWDWYWDWANIDAGWPGGDLLNPNSAAWQSNASSIREQAAIASWLSQLQPQSWYDSYGIPLDVARAQAGDWTAFTGWRPGSGVGSAQAAGKGRINGSYPTGTVDNESKGVEFELYAQPTKNWNITINASKQKATQTSLGTSLVNFIEAQHLKFLSPAGDLRLWWGGDQSLRAYYNQNIWAPYIFQNGASGRMVPEMSPWRFNLITNYTFDQGLAKGLNVGGAIRWEQGKILGYGLNTAGDNLDVDRPFWGKSEYWVDLWVGYTHKLSSRINWRIQFNVRNLDSRAHLKALTVQPDGSPAQFRIEEGQTWELTNSFTF